MEKIDLSATIKKAREILNEDKSSSPQTLAMLELLLVVITMLAGKLNLNSSNSSKPPSSDPNRKKKKTKGNKRKPGGQPGRSGTNLKPIEKPDAVEVLSIDKRTLPSGDYRFA